MEWCLAGVAAGGGGGSTDLQGHRQGLSLGAAVSHVGLDELEDVHRFPLDGAVCGDDHGLLDGLAAPGQHVGDGHLPPEQTLQTCGGQRRVFSWTFRPSAGVFGPQLKVPVCVC